MVAVFDGLGTFAKGPQQALAVVYDSRETDLYLSLLTRSVYPRLVEAKFSVLHHLPPVPRRFPFSHGGSVLWSGDVCQKVPGRHWRWCMTVGGRPCNCPS